MPALIKQQSVWGKATLYWKDSLASLGLAATSQAEDYEVGNIITMLDSAKWKATSTTDQRIWCDAGAGKTYAVDYLCLAGHNLAGAQLAFQYAGEDGVWHDRVPAYTVNSNGIIIHDLDSLASRKSCVLLTGLTTIPYITHCKWGPKTQLGRTCGQFDPSPENSKNIVVRAEDGSVLGVHDCYVEQTIRFSFSRAEDGVLDATLAEFYEQNGELPCFISWDPVSHPGDKYLLSLDPKRSSPFNDRTGMTRNLSLSFTGKKR